MAGIDTLVASVNNMITAVTTARDSMQQLVTDTVANVDTMLTAKLVELTQIQDNRLQQVLPPNMLRDHGRFTTNVNGLLSALLTNTFSTGHVFRYAYNGSAISLWGSHNYNTSSGGGSQAASSQQAIELLNKMGKTQEALRYTTSFNVMSIVAGSGTAAPLNGGGIDGVDYYLMCTNGLLLNENSTLAFWVKAQNGDIALRATYRDGVKLVTPGQLLNDFTVIKPADGWVHICMHVQSYSQNATLDADENTPLDERLGYGYNNSFPQVGAASAGVRALIAMPYLASGLYRIDPKQHEAVIPHRSV